MSGFVKLYGDQLLNSTVWVSADSATKLVWITLLLVADQHGIVNASVPGLAHQAGVTVEEAGKAINYLTAPDPHSRTKDYEGRRIEPLDGGWLVLNYMKYREYRSEKQVQEAERKRAYRQQQSDMSQMSQDVPGHVPPKAGRVPNVPGTSAQKQKQKQTPNPKETVAKATGAAAPKVEPDWKADAAVTLRAAYVPEKQIGDCLKNWWGLARTRGFHDDEIKAVVLAHGKRLCQPWNPAALWNVHNEEFSKRFRYHVDQQRKKRPSLTKVADVLQGAS